MINKLEIKCIPSTESNDHQAIIIVDGTDLLDRGYIGIDPPGFFRQKALYTGGKAIIGRCNCGCEGCDDIFAKINLQGESVIWKTDNKRHLITFNHNQYLTELKRAKSDHSWEDVNRTAERLVEAIIEKVDIIPGYQFGWASARIANTKITLSYSNGATQKLLEFPWNGIEPSDAEQAAKEFINKSKH